MTDPNTPSTARPPAARAAGAGLGAIIGVACLVTLLRIAYLVLWCPYNLVEDEAQYWLWSLYPQWSYATKGPGIAWAILSATGIYGDAEWAVRLPAAIFGGVGVLAAGGLTRDLARAAGLVRPGRVGVIAALVFATIPFVQMGSVLVTIDGPLIACWMVVAWAAWKALHERSGSAWLMLGSAVAVGFLFKYTMLLIVPGVLLHVWLCAPTGGLRASRRVVLWASAGLLIALLGLLPVVLWNADNDWATVRHLLGHLGLPGGDQPPAAGGGTNGGGRAWFEWLPVWSVQLALAQLGMVGPLLVVGVLGVWWLARPGQTAEHGPGAGSTESHATGAERVALLYPIHLAAPILVFYAIVAYIAEPEGNWPIAGSVTLVPLAVLVVRIARDRLQGDKRRWLGRLYVLGVLYGVLAIGLLHRADVAAGVVNRVMFLPPVSKMLAGLRSDGQPPRPIVTGRLIGAREMGVAVGRAMAQLRASTGKEPFVLAQHYGRASQMAYYAPWPTGEDGDPAPRAFCASAYTGGRKTPFDYIGALRLDRPELLGRPAVILSNDSADMLTHWRRMFETVVRYEPPDGGVRLPGEHKRDRVAYLGIGFRGQ